VDPSLWIASGTGQLPYGQTTSGTSTNSGGQNLPGLNLRLMILSSLSLPLPTSIDFNTAWATPDGSVPSGWPAPWAPSQSQGQDLHIQRVDLTPLFCRVILNPIDTSPSGSFAIETNGMGSSINPVPSAAGPATSWFLQGTVLRLYDYNTGSANLETKAIVQADCSYVFENMAWRGQVSGWGTNGPATIANSYSAWVAANNFASLASRFQAFGIIHQTGTATLHHDSTPEILGAFYTFMNDYDTWAQQGFDIGVFNNPSAAWSALMTDTNVIQGITFRMVQ
jgi:hypothetical protein